MPQNQPTAQYTETRRHEREILTRVSFMYYSFRETQQEIANKLGVSKMTVSRMIERARQLGIVTISVNTPFVSDHDLEAKLQSEYDLTHAMVLRLQEGMDRREGLARGCAFYLDTLIGIGDVVGIAPGRTLRRVMPHLTLPAASEGDGITVVQLTGGFPTPSTHNPTSSLHEFASQFGIKGYYFHRPFYAANVSDAVIFREHLDEDPIYDMWSSCDVVISGVGPVGENSIYRLENLLTKQEMSRLINKGAVGDVFGRWFDEDGEFIDDEVNQRVQGATTDVLRNASKVFVSAGSDRSRAIRALLRKRVVDVLITDAETASGLF